jgi:phosphatidylglycerophosphate synthase
VLGRDVLILGVGAWAFARTSVRELPPSIWGKFSTFFQMSTAGTACIIQAWPDFWMARLMPFWFWGAVVLTIWSGLDYLLAGLRRMRGGGLRAGQAQD